MSLYKIFEFFDFNHWILRAKPFGYFQYLNEVLPHDEIKIIRAKEQRFSQINVKNKTDRIYQWLTFYSIFDKALLRTLKKRRYINYVDFLINFNLRYLYYFINTCWYVIKGPN